MTAQNPRPRPTRPPRGRPKARAREPGKSRGAPVGSIPGEYQEFDKTAAEGGLMRITEKPSKEWLVLRAQYPYEEEPVGQPEDDEEERSAKCMQEMEAKGRFSDYEGAGHRVQNFIRCRVLNSPRA